MVGITNHHKIASESENIKEISFDCLHKGNINELVKGKKKSNLKLRFSIEIIKIKEEESKSNQTRIYAKLYMKMVIKSL